jgi:RNA polymerase sigma-70 factor (ECF subfamily)
MTFGFSEVGSVSQSEARRQMVALLPRLRRYALVLERSPDAADDLVQACLERALAKLDQWQPDSHLDRWMFQIMRSVWLNKRRGAALRRTENIDDHPDQMSVDGVGVADAKLTLAEVRAAFNELPEEQRQALFMVSVEGYTYSEASELLGVPISTLVGRLVRGRATLMAAQSGAKPDKIALFRPKAD